MQGPNQTAIQETNGRSLGGWLWVIMIILILNGIAMIVYLSTTTNELLNDDWRAYFSTTDELLKLRLNIHCYLVLTMIGNLIIIIWALRNFFRKTKKFPAIFMTLIGYAMLTEVIRIYLIDYYAELANIDGTAWLESNLAKVGIIGILAGLYLNKGKRPIQTFVN